MKTLTIDIEKMKQYMEITKEMIEENKAKGYDTDFLDGKLSVYEQILSGGFEKA